MYVKEHLKEIREDWLRRVNEKWKGLYDYSKVDYLNMVTPVTIHCNKHNLDFTQIPRQHLVHPGCPKCYSENFSSNTEEFIERAKRVHGDRYDYSKVKYERSDTPVTIICKVHGEFEQRPNNHLKGQNCPYCVGAKTVNTETRPHNPALAEKIMNFIKNEFPNEADNISVKYCVIGDSPATLHCKVHGDFIINPHTLFRKRTVGVCKKCSRNNDKYKLAFIEKSKKIHGDTIDYSKLDMTDKKVKLRCKIHDEWFEQDKRNHLMYSGCKKCILEKASLTQDEFIAKSKDMHGDKYDYSKVNYINNRTPVTIICPEHGEFKQLPYEHTRGKGCNTCACSYGHKKADLFLNSLGINYEKEFRFKEYLYRYDFYIPDVKLLIEIDGDLHRADGYTPSALEKRKALDKFKDDLAVANNMHLIRVDYLTSRGADAMLEDLIRQLRHFIKYIRDNKCYSNFGSYCQAYNLPGTTTPADCKEYSIDNIIARLLGD